MIHSQTVLKFLLTKVTQSTSSKPNFLKQYENLRSKRDCCLMLSFVTNALQIQNYVANYALLLFQHLAQLDFSISQDLAYRIIIVCLMISQKILEDCEHSLQDFSLTSRIQKKQLAELEIKILELLDYRVLIKQEEYEKFVKNYGGEQREQTNFDTISS